jgi:hypothetical protein
MERWRVPDATALELIEFPGKLGASGKRLRFRFTTRQQRIGSYLPEMDALQPPAKITLGCTARSRARHSRVGRHSSSTW